MMLSQEAPSIELGRDAQQSRIKANGQLAT